MNHADPNQQKAFGHILGQQYTVFDGLAGMYVEDIYQDRHGLLWIGTADGGVSRFDGAHFDTFGLSGSFVGHRPGEAAVSNAQVRAETTQSYFVTDVTHELLGSETST